jgi:hypothetical protein
MALGRGEDLLETELKTSSSVQKEMDWEERPCFSFAVLHSNRFRSATEKNKFYLNTLNNSTLLRPQSIKSIIFSYLFKVKSNAKV